MLNGLPWKRTEIILSFFKLPPSTAFWTLLLTMRATPFLLRDSFHSSRYIGHLILVSYFIQLPDFPLFSWLVLQDERTLIQAANECTFAVLLRFIFCLSSALGKSTLLLHLHILFLRSPES